MNPALPSLIHGNVLPILITALMWGLLGGFSHCIGMCGIFVLSCGPISEISARKRLARQLSFQLGRLVTLTLIGAAGGAVGSLVGFAAKASRAQGWLSVASGVLLSLLALGYAGIVPWFRVPEPDIMAAGGGFLRRRYASALAGRQWFQPLLLGGLVGVLPCGLTYTILAAAAATMSVGKGALVLFLFGLGTIPGLLAFGMLGQLFQGLFQRTSVRVAMTRSGAAIMLIMGLVLIWRGWPYLFY